MSVGVVHIEQVESYQSVGSRVIAVILMLAGCASCHGRHVSNGCEVWQVASVQPSQVSSKSLVFKKPPYGTQLRDGDAVFFVGNSFLRWNHRPLDQWIRAIGLRQTPPLRIKTGTDIVFGNTPLAGFLEHRATQEALRSGKYKVFVLQGEEYEPVDHKAAFHQSVRDFHQAITAAGGHTVLFMTWEFRFRQFINQLASSYDEIGTELGIPVVPVGIIYKDCECQPYGEQRPFWLTDGDLHENEKGTAVNAFATFQMLTGIETAGENFRALGNTNDDGSMRYFAKMTWNRVAPRLGF